MKYAKKMKLIEIDDINVPSPANNSINIDDENYSKPRVLSTLDNIMNEILSKPIISDVDKWQLYSQALQRYLNHVKHTSQRLNYNPLPPENVKSVVSTVEDPFNFSLPQNDMSGVYPIRDSLDSISQPAVRDFFEKARKSNDTGNITSPLLPMDIIDRQPTPKKRKAKKPSNPRRVLPYQTLTRAGASKRRAENSISAEMSNIRPCKVMLNRLNWEPTNAR